MNILSWPWLEIALLLPLFGASIVHFLRDPRARFWCCLAFSGTTLACAILAASCSSDVPAPQHALTSVRSAFIVDELNALLLPLVALLHFLTALTTARTTLQLFSFSGLLFSSAIRMATFACVDPWLLIGLLTLDTVLPALTHRNRTWPSRAFALHAGVFVTLLVIGWALVNSATLTGLGAVLMLLAVIIRTGLAPAHLWVTELFDKGSFGITLLLTVTLPGVYAAVRLAIPHTPSWALEATSILALMTSLYAAGRGIVQTDVRQFIAYFYLSHAALVLVGLGLDTPLALTGALVMWLTAAVSLTGMGLILRAVEARVGSIELSSYHGLYDAMPALAIGFLLTGLAAVGFPGTSGFVAIELLVDEAVGAHLAAGLIVVLTTAVNGIGVLRAYLLLFTGKKHVTGVSLGITRREKIALLTLLVLIIGGGLVPQAYLESRQRAAREILRGQHDHVSPDR